MNSIIQNQKECYLCRELFGVSNCCNLECHHIFGGSNRKHSEKYGLKVYLCQMHHNTSPNGVHFNYELMKFLRAKGQQAFEVNHSHEVFMKIFGRNYLD